MDNGKYYFGDSVRTRSHGHVGTIYEKHYNFSATGESESWLLAQRPALPKSAKHEVWYSMLTEHGGSVCVPESEILRKLKAPADLCAHPWRDFYFGGAR